MADEDFTKLCDADDAIQSFLSAEGDSTRTVSKADYATLIKAAEDILKIAGAR